MTAISSFLSAFIVTRLLAFSAFYNDARTKDFRSHVVAVATDDFRHYSAPLFVLDGTVVGGGKHDGMCSPNLFATPAPERGADNPRGRGKLPAYVMSFNSWSDGRLKDDDALYYLAADDLFAWGGADAARAARALAPSLTRGRRAIDAALARRL